MPSWKLVITLFTLSSTEPNILFHRSFPRITLLLFLFCKLRCSWGPNLQGTINSSIMYAVRMALRHRIFQAHSPSNPHTLPQKSQFYQLKQTLKIYTFTKTKVGFFRYFFSDVCIFSSNFTEIKSNNNNKRKTASLSPDKGQTQQRGKRHLSAPLMLKPFVYFLDLFEKKEKPKPTESRQGMSVVCLLWRL